VSGPKTPAFDPEQVPTQSGSLYPEPFRSRVGGRHRKRLGDAGGLKNFGVNLVTLDPKAQSAMRHWHSKQDELIFVLEGELTLVTDSGRQKLGPGMFAAFPAGRNDGHHLVNEGISPAKYLEVGDRSSGDEVLYPDVDMTARTVNGKIVFAHKDGSPYE